jgi:hypothetical protein
MEIHPSALRVPPRGLGNKADEDKGDLGATGVPNRRAGSRPAAITPGRSRAAMGIGDQGSDGIDRRSPVRRELNRRHSPTAVARAS